jgi:hypothetical protein
MARNPKRQVNLIVSLGPEFFGVRERLFSGIRGVFAGIESYRRKSPKVNRGDGAKFLPPLGLRRTGCGRRVLGDVHVAFQSLTSCRASQKVRLWAV